MTTGNILYMLAVLGVVWGGFALCLFLLARQGRHPEASDPEASDPEESP